ncbi:hypothetical protein [Micromonospora auratinigra]|nr:hypothetical protein [Micromonospora auratinigra]
MSHPSYEDHRDPGAAHRPSYPSAAPVGPPARWGLADGRPPSTAPEPAYPGGAPGYPAPAAVPGYGGQGETSGYGGAGATPGYGGAPAPGYGGAPTPGYPGAELPGHGAPAGTTGLGGAEAPRYGAPNPGPSGYGHQAAPAGYAAAESAAYPVREAPRYGAPESPAYPTEAPAYGYGAPEAPRYGMPEAPRYGAPEQPTTPTTPGTPAPGAPAAWTPSGGQGGAAEPAADGYSGQAVQNQIRQAVVHRVQYANALHASHFWDLRRTKPVGPHALVFLYAGLDPRFSNPRRPYYEIKAASRLFRDGSDVQDLPALLHELTEIAKGYLADGRVFDPVAQMTQSADAMPADAKYVGVAVSTLLGTGEDLVDEPMGAIGGMGIPGKAMVVLSDNHQLVVERPARAHEQVEIYSTFPYITSGGVDYRSWRSFTPEQQADPAWRWLQHLNQLVLTGQERKTSATAAATSGGRRRR